MTWRAIWRGVRIGLRIARLLRDEGVPVPKVQEAESVIATTCEAIKTATGRSVCDPPPTSESST